MNSIKESVMATALRLLILEDDAFDAELEVATLGEAGYVCRWERVETRAEFLACLDAPDYDVILADYNLPAFDGLTALQLFLDRDLDLPFILVSGTMGEETAIESLKAGATDYVLKDRLTRLGPVMKRALREKEERQQRRQAEEALQKNQQLLNAIVDNSPMAIQVKDLEGRYLLVNRQIEKLLGLRRREAVGRTPHDVYPPQLADEFLAADRDALEAGTAVQSEELIPLADGTHTFLATKFPLVDAAGVPYAIAGISTDITERVQSEEERVRLLAQIREQALRTRQIVDTVPEGVLLLEAGSHILLANPPAREYLSVLAGIEMAGDLPQGPGEVLTRLGDRPLPELLTMPPQGVWHEVVATGRRFEVIARPMENGREPGDWVLVIRDVTQEREIQQRAQQQERLAAVGQLAAGIAHDFNNIMAVIVLYARMTSRDRSLPDSVRERLEIIAQQAEQATNLIQQILDFSRRSVLERRPVDLLSLVKEQVKLLERTLPENIEICLVCEAGDQATLFAVNADPTRMQQMVMNLAVNARDAMPEGGKLIIGLDWIRFESGEEAPLPGMSPGEWVRVTVEDTGTGIPPDVEPRIFEPFFTTKAPLGSGLGLAQVYGIIKQHEGEIDLVTKVGRGTTFTLYLPALPIAAAAHPSPGASALSYGAEEVILVIEDDAAVRSALVATLETLNYRTLEAANGRDALAILEQGEEVALVLTDLVMPEMGGTALFRALQQRGAAVPVVMLTGHPLEEELQKLQEQGLAGWLLKPPTLERLSEVITQVLGEAGERA
jgi:two-component system cell cycle sensor histidine kinase/response regulator CckA